MDKKVLIVGTSPYNMNTPARAFDSYFHFFKKFHLAQVFSSPAHPLKGHCGAFFQMTDKDMLYRWVKKKKTIGTVYLDEELQYFDEQRAAGADGTPAVINLLYRLGHNKNSLVYLLRGVLWRKKYWCTPAFNEWLEGFRPDCVFLSFSDDYFIPKIALYIAKKFNIPIVSSIGDDYYFNYRFSLSPLYHLYKSTYRKLIRKVFGHPGSAIYIGNKIRDKYNAEFGLGGETVYLTSTIQRRAFKKVDTAHPKISYFGNIRLGRNESLAAIADVLGEINREYRLDVYSGEIEVSVTSVLEKCPNVTLHSAIPYNDVVAKTLESDIIVIPEGFKRKDVDISRYSLSTKVADSLASGVNVLAYGSIDCGTIEYALETDAITTCTERSSLKSALHKLIFDKAYQEKNYNKAKQVFETNHSLRNSCRIFEGVIEKVTRENE